MGRPTLSRAVRELVHPAYKRLEMKSHVLRTLFIEVTQRCNLACLHCEGDCTSSPKPGELSTEEWLRFFHYLGQSFDRHELTVVVTGGEPLCAPNFDRLVLGLNANQLQWGLISNGWALTADKVDLLVERGASTVSSSLDGLEETHDWLRGKKGSFDHAIRGLGQLVTAGTPHVEVITCVNPRNLEQLPRLLTLVRGLGVHRWLLYATHSRGRARSNPEVLLTSAQLKELFDWVGNTRAQLPPGGLSVEYGCDGYLPRDVDRAVRDNPFFCRAGINIASVLCDGSISACSNGSRSLVQGNVRTDDFKTVWEDKFDAFRVRDWLRTGRCAGCAEWSKCQGSSTRLCDEEQGTGSCYVEQLEAASRGEELEQGAPSRERDGTLG